MYVCMLVDLCVICLCFMSRAQQITEQQKRNERATTTTTNKISKWNVSNIKYWDICQLLCTYTNYIAATGCLRTQCNWIGKSTRILYQTPNRSCFHALIIRFFLSIVAFVPFDCFRSLYCLPAWPSAYKRSTFNILISGWPQCTINNCVSTLILTWNAILWTV